jgi:hypothetical protein
MECKDRNGAIRPRSGPLSRGNGVDDSAKADVIPRLQAVHTRGRDRHTDPVLQIASVQYLKEFAPGSGFVRTSELVSPLDNPAVPSGQ